MHEDRFRLEPDPDDNDGQSLLFWYPAFTATTNYYRGLERYLAIKQLGLIFRPN